MPLAAAILLMSARAVAAAQPGGISIDRLYAAYASGDYQVIERTVMAERTYDLLRADLRPAVERWKRKRNPKQAVFMIEFALVGFNHQWRYWLDALDKGRDFVVDRPDPPGQNLKEDQFEIAWHKAAVALLEGLVRPDLVSQYGVSPLAGRMQPEPSSDCAHCLIDPWIELSRGVIEEQWTISRPDRLPKLGLSALQHYENAARYGSTREEAVARKSWMLVRLGRPAEALAALDRLRDPIDDPVIRYWSRLFRGRALEDVGQADEAARAYEEARVLAPGSQAPAVALAALELRRNRFDQAFTWALSVRSAPAETDDPWWGYPYADHRFFRERLIRLREMSQ